MGTRYMTICVAMFDRSRRSYDNRSSNGYAKGEGCRYLILQYLRKIPN